MPALFKTLASTVWPDCCARARLHAKHYEYGEQGYRAHNHPVLFYRAHEFISLVQLPASNEQATGKLILRKRNPNIFRLSDASAARAGSVALKSLRLAQSLEADLPEIHIHDLHDWILHLIPFFDPTLCFAEFGEMILAEPEYFCYK